MFYWNLSHGWKVCLDLLGSLCPPVHLSILPSVHLPVSFCSPFCLFRSVSFLGIYTLVFCDIWHGMRAPYGIVCGIFTEKSGLGKNDQKMAQKWNFSTIFKNFVITFCLKH